MGYFFTYTVAQRFAFIFIYTLQFIVVIVPTILMSLLLRNNLGYKTKFVGIIGTGIIGITVWKFSYAITSEPYPIYIGYLINAVMIFALCNGDRLNKAFWSIALPVYINLATLIWSLTMTLIAIFFPSIDYTIRFFEPMQYSAVCLRFLINIAVFILIFLILNSGYKKYKITSPRNFVIILPLLSVHLIFSYISIFNMETNMPSASDQSLAIILTSNLLNLLVMVYSFYAFKQIELMNYEKLNLSAKLLEQYTRLEYFHEIEASTTVLRKWNHDWSQHMDMITTLLQNEAYEELNDYVSHIKSSNLKFNFIVNTGFKTVDALISQKIIIAEDKGISFRKKIIFPATLNLTQTDFSIILGNLLDNAIEACDKIIDGNEKYISLDIQAKGEMLILSVENSSLGDHIVHDEYFLTTKKKDSCLHGIGCRRVAEITEKNMGICSFDATDSMFTANIALPLMEVL